MEYSYLIKNVINNTVVYNLKTQTILQACMGLGIEIPRYCFHNRLSIAGNCRMCLVEVYGIQKPVASCAQKVADGNVIVTNSEMVRRIREGISQFLLYNHPLDCAVCDQGGECDLQDQVLVYGTDKGRFFDFKRASYDKECGPLIKTVMTRCIHCTRCARFLNEISGSSDLSVMGRGQTMEISGYLDQVIDSELSGNLIDLCPVGALTSKPGAYSSRSWELRSIETIDVFDNLGSNIRIDTGFSEIVRIAPVSNDLLNEEWISDKVRFSFDGLSNSRIGAPMMKVGGVLSFVNWDDLLVNLFNKISINDVSNLNFSSIVSKEVDLESMYLAKNLTNFLGSSLIKDEYDVNNISYDFINSISFNNNFDFIEKFDKFLLVGMNLRLESPILNLKLRKKYLINGNTNYLIGTYYSSTFPLVHLGNNVSLLDTLFDNKEFLRDIKKKKLLVLFNNNLPNKEIYLNLVNKLNKLNLNNSVDCRIISNFSNFMGWSELSLGQGTYSSINSFNNLNDSYKYMELDILKLDLLSLIGVNSRLGYYLNYKKHFNNSKLFNYYLNTSNISDIKCKDGLNIYHGHHGNSKILSEMDFVLPSLSFIEKKGTYINIYNLIQQTSVVFTAPKLSRNDFDIYKVLFSFFIYLTKESNKQGLDKMIFEFMETGGGDFNEISLLVNKLVSTCSIDDVVLDTNFNVSNSYNGILYSSIWENFYKTNLITKSSKIMDTCTNNLRLNYNYFLKEVR